MTSSFKAPSRRHLLTGLTGGILAIPSFAAAHGYTSGDLEIDHPTITLTRGRTGVHAGYMTIINRGRSADRLLAATSPRARTIELHTHVRDGQVMRMRPVEGGIAIPAGGRVQMAPGGLHLMFFGVTGTVADGDAVPVTLQFERAGRVEVVAMGETRLPAPTATVTEADVAMSDPFLVPITLVIGATSLVLAAGVIGLARPFFHGQQPGVSGTTGKKTISRSNQLMRARVVLQAVAVLLILAGAAYKKSHQSDPVAEARSGGVTVAAVASAAGEAMR